MLTRFLTLKSQVSTLFLVKSILGCIVMAVIFYDMLAINYFSDGIFITTAISKNNPTNMDKHKT